MQSTEPHHIDSIVACICVDPVTGEEGIMGHLTERGWMPLIASDRVRFDLIKGLATEIAEAGKMKVSFVRFSVRTEEGSVDYRTEKE